MPTTEDLTATPALPTSPRRARHGWLAAVLLGAVAALLLAASCGTIRTLVDLDNDLKAAGFSDLHVNTNESNGFSTVTVRASSGPSPSRAAEVVWKKFPRRVDSVVVELNSQSTFFSRSEMRDRFGPRPAGYDDKTIGSDVRSGVVTFLLVLFAVFVVGGGIIAFIVLKVHSNKRKRRIAAGGYPNPPQWGPPPGAWGQPPQPGPWGQPQPPPPAQWGQQAPPGQWGQGPPPGPTQTDPGASGDADSYPPPPPPPRR